MNFYHILGVKSCLKLKVLKPYFLRSLHHFSWINSPSSLIKVPREAFVCQGILKLGNFSKCNSISYLRLGLLSPPIRTSFDGLVAAAAASSAVFAAVWADFPPPLFANTSDWWLKLFGHEKVALFDGSRV